MQNVDLGGLVELDYLQDSWDIEHLLVELQVIKLLALDLLQHKSVGVLHLDQFADLTTVLGVTGFECLHLEVESLHGVVGDVYVLELFHVKVILHYLGVLSPCPEAVGSAPLVQGLSLLLDGLLL